MAILVLFIGKRVNHAIRLLRELSIPEPVTGGLLISIIITAIYLLTGIEISFELAARDILLMYFFTTIGINASFKDLLSGGKPLIYLLAITTLYMILQNITGVTIASLLGLSAPVGLLGGSVSLIGGHGTAIAWAPLISSEYSIPQALEIGIACATFGLILASVMGGPIAKLLISRYRLECTRDEPQDVGVRINQETTPISYLSLLDAILAIHLSILLGFLLNLGLEHLGLKLPMFVTCLFAGILMTNLRPGFLPRITGTAWPSRTPAMSLVADVSLGTFLAMSLMSMQLWSLAGLAGAILVILAAQLLVVILIALLVVFPLLGRSYDAAVICAGFTGFSLGATPTAIANMSAVTQRYGASHQAFIIIPLIGAFFIDLINAILIPFFLAQI